MRRPQRPSHILSAGIALALLIPSSFATTDAEEISKKTTFSGTTAETQRQELAQDPAVLRFREARAALQKDPFYPKYHFIAPENPIGDPNGLCYWQGRWHLFYQFRPADDPEITHWGHAVSDDLIHWEDLPIPFEPTPGFMCFSGSALVEEDRVLAIYHATAEVYRKLSQ